MRQEANREIDPPAPTAPGGPGRACPLDYRTGPEALAKAPVLEAETLYVVGGLYGNVEALAAVGEMMAAESRCGERVRTVFNGDFHWFDVDPDDFALVNREVLRHHATQGNIEAELSAPASGAGCGCGYPPWVSQAVVDRSNRIMVALQRTAAARAADAAALADLPRQIVAEVGGLRVGIVHGDPESLAGWGLAAEVTEPFDVRLRNSLGCTGAPGISPAVIRDWFRRARVDAFASTHTCLPVARDLAVDGRARVMFNNGSAGMPNFRARQHGLLTRISARGPAPADALYGTSVGDVRFDALPIRYDQRAWLERFERNWPPGSPAHASYHRRIVDGPDFAPRQAAGHGMRLREPGVRDDVAAIA